MKKMALEVQIWGAASKRFREFLLQDAVKISDLNGC